MSTRPVSVDREAVAPAPTRAPDAEQSIVEGYAQMAHSYESRRADGVLRGLDVVLTATALVVLAPVMALVALAVALTDRGPVLYRGARIGRAGRVFTMHKFRTLRPDAETRLGPYLGPELTALTTGEHTRIGRALRASKLDELPQLWDVLRGHMSLVGPRPIRPAFFEELCLEIPQYWQRLVVRPGVTGLAQLRLTRDMTWAEKLAHDLEYIADRSVGLYVFVIAATAWQVVSLPVRVAARLIRRSG